MRAEPRWTSTNESEELWQWECPPHWDSLVFVCRYSGQTWLESQWATTRLPTEQNTLTTQLVSTGEYFQTNNESNISDQALLLNEIFSNHSTEYLLLSNIFRITHQLFPGSYTDCRLKCSSSYNIFKQPQIFLDRTNFQRRKLLSSLK